MTKHTPTSDPATWDKRQLLNEVYSLSQKVDGLNELLFKRHKDIDELVEALKDIIKECETTPAELSEACLGVIKIKALKAIKKAEGK